ncbi:TPA: DUF5361 domain-containing protein [Streptococcus pyogenes]|nr:DUF5361 domain-containing protein [Streptococcus pyogenes]
MIAKDDDALTCDLAETYGIYDYRQLPAYQVAVFAVGLRSNSRIKMALSGEIEALDTVLLAGIYDNTNLLFWSKTKDGQSGQNKPKSVVEAISGSKSQKANDVISFVSGEDFENARKQLLGGDG